MKKEHFLLGSVIVLIVLLIFSINSGFKSNMKIAQNLKRIAELEAIQLVNDKTITKLKETERILLIQVEDLKVANEGLQDDLLGIGKEYNELKEKYKKNKALRQQELKDRMVSNGIEPSEVLVKTDRAEIGLLNVFLSLSQALSSGNIQAALIINLTASIDTWKSLFDNKVIQYNTLNSSYMIEKNKYQLQTDNFNNAMKQVKWHKLKEKIGGSIIVLLVVLNLLK